MTAPAFTPEQFDAAIQELVAAGKIRTVRKLREKLGGGSNDTIILRAKVETLERESAPSAITPARLEELLRLLQQQAIVAKPPQKTRRVADVDANGSRPVPRRKRSKESGRQLESKGQQG